jgi:hypothetical protein
MPLSQRKHNNRVWSLWRGAFLRYSAIDEPDSAVFTDCWACLRVEAMGLDPRVKPGKTEYLRLCSVLHQTYRKFQSMADEYRLFWQPPTQRPDPALAKILNALTGNHVDEDDAALVMSAYNERVEAKATERGFKLVRCPIPSQNVLQCCEMLGAINDENIRRCLDTFSKNFPEEISLI